MTSGEGVDSLDEARDMLELSALFRTPFMALAKEEGYPFKGGGKVDDVAIVCGVVRNGQRPPSLKLCHNFDGEIAESTAPMQALSGGPPTGMVAWEPPLPEVCWGLPPTLPAPAPSAAGVCGSAEACREPSLDRRRRSEGRDGDGGGDDHGSGDHAHGYG